MVKDGYLALDQNIGNGLEANVTFERKLAYESASTTNNVVVYDLSIIMDTDSIKVTGTNNATGITGEATYDLTDDLRICNNGNHTIQLQRNNSTKDILGTYKSIDILTDDLIDNIKISYSTNYGPHEIDLENNATNPLSVYIFKQKNAKVNTYTNLKGSIKFYDNLSSVPIVEQSTNGVYDITVDIYKVESSNKVKFIVQKHL